MKTFRKCLLAGALVASALAATSSAAQAGVINGAGSGATFTAGATRFNAALDVSCTGSTVVGTIPNGTAAPVTVPITLTYTGCSTSLGGATVHCRGVTLTASTAGGGVATGQVNVPQYSPTPPASGAGCRIVTSTGCEIRVASAPTALPVTATDGGSGRAVITVQRTGLGFTTSGGFACLFINSGTAFYESTPANGDIPYTETTGSNISFV